MFPGLCLPVSQPCDRSVASVIVSHGSLALVSLVVSLVLSRVDYGNATLAGIPAYAISRLQSALNASARLVFSLQKYDSVMLLLQELHWLKVEQRIEYKLAVLVYRCLHGIAPQYLANDFRRVADLGTRRRLRSASTPALVVPPSRLSTVGDRAFPVAAVRVWNSLPDFVTASTSQPMFKRHLKTVLFAKSYRTLAVSDDLNTFHRTSFYLRLILFGVLAVVLTLCHLNHICLLTS